MYPLLFLDKYVCFFFIILVFQCCRTILNWGNKGFVCTNARRSHKELCLCYTIKFWTLLSLWRIRETIYLFLRVNALLIINNMWLSRWTLKLFIARLCYLLCDKKPICQSSLFIKGMNLRIFRLRTSKIFLIDWTTFFPLSWRSGFRFKINLLLFHFYRYLYLKS